MNNRKLKTLLKSKLLAPQGATYFNPHKTPSYSETP